MHDTPRGQQTTVLRPYALRLIDRIHGNASVEGRERLRDSPSDWTISRTTNKMIAA